MEIISIAKEWKVSIMSKSVFKILSYLRKNHVNKDGKVRIMLRLSVNGEVSQFSSKLDIELELWDVKSEKLSRIVKNFAR